MNSLKVITLGGVDEIGKNLTAYEYKDDILLVDCGSSFPDQNMVGVQCIIPDFTYIEQNLKKIRGLIITHGHEDHIGGIPYLINKFDIPIYGTRLTLEIIKNKLIDTNSYREGCLNERQVGNIFTLGCFSIEMIHVTHSILDSVALAISTPIGTIIHTGDYKVDMSPINHQKPFDLQKFAHYGSKGVLLLCSDSTNAEVPGFTPSEAEVAKTLDTVFELHPTNRILIASFSTNFNRLQTFINLAQKYNRKVAVSGRSMVKNMEVGIGLGYLKNTSDLMIDVETIEDYDPSKVLVITTGSQGEVMSSLQRMVVDENKDVVLSQNDVVVLSSKTIPGNEKAVGAIINALIKKGIEVIKEPEYKVHVSGHACQEELKIIQSLVRPKFFMPLHGEARHLYANKKIAKSVGIPEENIFIPELGSVLEVDRKSARFVEPVTAGEKLISSSMGIGDVGNVVANERRILAQEGIVVVVLNLSRRQKTLATDPEVFCKGFVYLKGSEDLLEGIRRVARCAALNSITFTEINYKTIKKNVRDATCKYIIQKTNRSPFIMPIIVTSI